MEYIIMNDEQRDIINIAKNSRKELFHSLKNVTGTANFPWMFLRACMKQVSMRLRFRRSMAD